MNILNIVAQSSEYYSTYNTMSDAEAVSGAALLAIFMSFFVIGLIFGVLVYVFVSICLMRIFAKAGVKPWIAWVPFYNNWKLLEIGGQPGFWAVLTIIPLKGGVGPLTIAALFDNVITAARNTVPPEEL